MLRSANVNAQNANDLIEVKLTLSVYTVKGNSVKLAVRMRHEEPARISNRAGRSNLQMNFSLRNIIERIA